MQEVGFVISSKNFLVNLKGLPSIKLNDLIQSENGVRGLISALYPDKVEALILDEGQIIPGQVFKRVDTALSINVGDFLLGRAINPLGVPIDGKGLLSKSAVKNFVDLEKEPPGIGSRQFIKDQFITGISLIDTLMPIGKGQRQLIIGDTHSGKTAFLVDLIVNQKDSGVICIYGSVGKPIISIRNMIDILSNNKAMEQTIIVAASSSDLAPLIFLTPHACFSLAEYFQKKGKDVLLILDDLGNHAKIYREITLLGQRFPGRESYPGDIFFAHAHLLERAGNFKPEAGGGSITAVPLIELNLSDMTSFIPTNLMAMTDGHLLFKSALHNQGQRPAIDISLSVTRVGRQTQNRVQNLISARVRQVLAQAAQLETISQFSSELPVQTQSLINQRALIEEIINQEPLNYIPPEVQVIILALVFTNFLQTKNREFLKENKQKLIDSFLKDPKLSKITNSMNKLDDVELIKLLEEVEPYLNELCSPKK